MQIELTNDQAAALYQWLESAEGLNYWETPLAPVQSRLSDWHRYESPIGPDESWTAERERLTAAHPELGRYLGSLAPLTDAIDAARVRWAAPEGGVGS